MARYRHYYEIEVRHPGLHKYRHIRGTDAYVVQQKALALEQQWDREWERHCEIQDRRQARISALETKEALKEEAADRTETALASLAAAEGLLAHTLTVDDRIDWESLKDRSPFNEPLPLSPIKETPPQAPVPTDPIYKPKRDFICWFSNARRARFDAEAAARFQTAVEAHRILCDRAAREFVALQRRHADQVAAREASRAAFEADQQRRNAEIDARRAAVESGEEGAVVDMIDLALSNSNYPEFINLDFNIDYLADVKSLVLDFDLPAPDAMPTLKEVRYIQARNEFSEKHITEAERGRLYDSVLYQIALRTLHEVFEADEHRHVRRITFNGWVNYVDKATGADQRSCILSVGANREDFERIDLARVDPKECFRALKGVAAAKLIGLAAVPPLERPRVVDTRFVESREVADGVDASVNLASMDWQEFEHLVRQVFEAEFATVNGEVRVTRASRDGGVDAIVFDPDPIKGGKIIIQAKRYVNPVDVGSVRDLYGTVQHEGATKGILVTTSQYGPDARKFAQDKPLTLLDGGNLLHLLEKMGVKARIDLKEAREQLLLHQNS